MYSWVSQRQPEQQKPVCCCPSFCIPQPNGPGTLESADQLSPKRERDTLVSQWLGGCPSGHSSWYVSNKGGKFFRMTVQQDRAENGGMFSSKGPAIHNYVKSNTVSVFGDSFIGGLTCGDVSNHKLTMEKKRFNVVQDHAGSNTVVSSTWGTFNGWTSCSSCDGDHGKCVDVDRTYSPNPWQDEWKKGMYIYG